jgi:hypothetical protein
VIRHPILDEAATALDRAGQLLSAHLASTELATGQAILTNGGPGN